MPGRKFNATNEYRYGFNGKEKDKDAGEGIQDYGMRIYDSRLGRFLSVDRLEGKSPFFSPYSYAGNKPISCIDLDGDVEVIVNVTTYNKDGTLLKTTTYKFNEIETIEDLKGIHRTPIIINVTEKIETLRFVYPTYTVYYDQPVVKTAIIQKGTGLSNEEDLSQNGSFNDKVATKVYKTLVKFWPPAKIADAQHKRDPLSGEYRPDDQALWQTAEGILDIVTLGKGALGKDALKTVLKSQSKKLIDWGAEEIIKTVSNQLGLNNSKQQVFYYYILKYAKELKDGDFKDKLKAVNAVIKLVGKGASALDEFKRIGIDLDKPQGKSDAAQEALKKLNINVKVSDAPK